VNLITDKKGFTFIELSVVMAILTVLSAIAITYFNDVFARGRDSAAVSDAISLITVVNNNFLDKKSVNYEATSPDGRYIGIEDEDGNPISPAVTLSPGVRCKFYAAGNYSPSDEGSLGNFWAFIYHFQGTPEPSDTSGAGVFRRGVEVIINEATKTHTHTLF